MYVIAANVKYKKLAAFHLVVPVLYTHKCLPIYTLVRKCKEKDINYVITGLGRQLFKQIYKRYCII